MILRFVLDGVAMAGLGVFLVGGFSRWSHTCLATPWEQRLMSVGGATALFGLVGPVILSRL